MRPYLTLLGICLLICVSAQDSLNVRHLFNWNDVSIPIGSQGLQNRYNEVWGYSADGREYAFLGSTLGVHVFDVTDPMDAVLVDMVLGRHAGEGVVHRDYKTYQHYLYATCDQGPSSLQIMDLQYLPDSVHLIYDSQELLTRAHNIQIDTLNARLYTCGGSTQFSVYSLQDPEAPTLMSDLEADVAWWGNTVGYVHDCHVRDNIVWVNDEDGMHVLDLTDPLSPILLGSLTNYPDQGYNHSGWLNEAGTVYAMADETHGSPVKLVDATDLGDLQIVNTLTTGISPTSVLHNPFYTGDLLHCAYYHDGYSVWDTSDPLQPLLKGFYDTSPVPNGETWAGAWGTYPFLPSGKILVSDMQTGLWVLEVLDDTGVQDRKSELVRIHPTLTDGLVRVRPIQMTAASMTIRVMDAAGRLVSTTHASSNEQVELDLRGEADGPYMVMVITGREKHTQRIVKSSNR